MEGLRRRRGAVFRSRATAPQYRVHRSSHLACHDSRAGRPPAHPAGPALPAVTATAPVAQFRRSPFTPRGAKGKIVHTVQCIRRNRAAPPRRNSLTSADPGAVAKAVRHRDERCAGCHVCLHPGSAGWLRRGARRGKRAGQGDGWQGEQAPPARHPAWIDAGQAQQLPDRGSDGDLWCRFC